MTTSTRPTTYETDFYAWTQQQAELLRQGRFADVDLENMIEEIESLGKRDFLSFISAIFRLTQHLLKWQYQPEKRIAKLADNHPRTAAQDPPHGGTKPEPGIRKTIG